MEMAINLTSDYMRLVFGLGDTGWSVAKYLRKRGSAFVLADTRSSPPHLADAQREMAEVEVFLKEIPPSIMKMVDEVVLSPGIDLSHPLVREMRALSKRIIGDVELWRHSVTQPVIAVSGSNGKSTVTSLLAAMAKAQGINAEVGGNLGKPVLSFRDDAELYIVELSSFQLDLTQNLEADVACLLNVTPDHMERYPDFIDYYNSKQRIFNGCKAVVYNKQDKLTRPLKMPLKNICFSASQPDINDMGIISRGDLTYLCEGTKVLLDTREIKIIGRHNHLNVLAALATAKMLGWSLEKCLEGVKSFTGLPHRCQRVGEVNGVIYINDSKATNPDATYNSLSSMIAMRNSSGGAIHLILGGSSKEADFSKLLSIACNHGVRFYLIGEEGKRINSMLGESEDKLMCGDLAAAVESIYAAAQPKDIVLFSPACASFDAYPNFAARGDDFIGLVNSLAGGSNG